MNTAIDLNNRALAMRKSGQLGEAEELLRQALTLDEKLLGLTHPKIPHRLNNLCTLLIMQGKLAEAKPLLARAWQLKFSQHDLTSARLLFVFLTTAMLEGHKPGTFLAQLKKMLAAPGLPNHADVAQTWDIACFIEHLRPKLGAANADFLNALSAAMNDRGKTSGLELFPRWREQAALPLEDP